ncbi:MAG: efflux transporter outer membrane subunit [Rhodoferax sp.]
MKHAPFPPAAQPAWCWRLAAGLAALGLAACAPMPSTYERPAAPVPPQWPAGTAAPGAVDAARTHWRAYFTDPRLQALIAQALENNRDMRIAAGRVLEARAQFGIVKADGLPLVNLLGSGSLGRGNAVLDVSISSVSFELDFWGRVSSLSEAARASYLATQEARRAIYISLVADVASAYFTGLQLDELIRIARATVVLRDKSAQLIARGRDLGGANDYDFQQATGALESARASLAALEHQRSVTDNLLTYLVGKTPEGLPPGRPLDAQGLDTALAPGLPADVLLMRPDVMASEQRLLAAHANIGAARAAFLPKVLLTAGLGLAGPGLASLFKAGAWAFQPVITMPLFDGGRAAAAVDIAEARKIIAVAEYEKTLQLAFREVADQLSARQSLARQMQATTANTLAQERRLQIAEARYQVGLVGYLDVLDGQRELVAAQQAIAQTRRAQLESAVQLYKALGGGSQIEPEAG